MQNFIFVNVLQMYLFMYLDKIFALGIIKLTLVVE
jgi:hypothetical protein